MEAERTDLKQELNLKHNRINIHKPDFLNWQAAFILAEQYLKDLTKEEEVGNSSTSRRIYDIKYEPGKVKEVSLIKRVGATSTSVIIEETSK